MPPDLKTKMHQNAYLDTVAQSVSSFSLSDAASSTYLLNTFT